MPCQKEGWRTGIDLGGISVMGWRSLHDSVVVISRIGCVILLRYLSSERVGNVDASIRTGESSMWSDRAERLLFPTGRSGLLAIGE